MRRGQRKSPMESPRSCRVVPSSSTPDMSIVKTEFTPSPHLLDHGYGVTPESQIIPSVIPSQAPAVKRKLNLESQHIVVPIKQEFKAPPPKKQRRATPTKKNTRYDTSLGLLTRKFTMLLEQSPDGVVDLNKASEVLQVQKRRIYDITNVLEGIGILEKKSKNNIQWKGGSKGSHAFNALKDEVQCLQEQENHLDRLIAVAENELCKLSNDKYGYVTYQDLRSIAKYKNKTVMAIKAPPNTKLSVPEDEDDKYKILMKSDSGEIEVFLCPDSMSTPKAKEIPPMDRLLEDIKLSPDLLNLKTPPVPRFDSPTQHKPISTKTCRNLSFTKEYTSSDSGPSRTAQKNLFSMPSSSTSHTNDVDLNSLNIPAWFSPNTNGLGIPEVPEKMATVFLTENEELSSMDRCSLPLDDNTGILDPLFYAEPFVPLEPLPHSEYNFSLDTSEGLADLFDLM